MVLVRRVGRIWGYLLKGGPLSLRSRTRSGKSGSERSGYGLLSLLTSGLVVFPLSLVSNSNPYCHIEAGYGFLGIRRCSGVLGIWGLLCDLLSRGIRVSCEEAISVLGVLFVCVLGLEVEASATQNIRKGSFCPSPLYKGIPLQVRV